MKDNPSDKVYTPDHIVDEVMEIFNPQIGDEELILEPFKGGGAFYDKFPSRCLKEYCEIDEGVDFMGYTKRVDWIITNPPYSIFKEILPHCLSLADEIVLVIPVNKILSSMPRLMDIVKSGHNIKHIHYLGSGRQLGFPFGFPVGAVHIQRGYHGFVEITYADRCYKARA